jgi:hypothetical protein
VPTASRSGCSIEALGVAEYWVVDLDARAFERSTPAEARPKVLTDRMVWAPAGAAQPLVIDIPAYFEARVGA